MKLTVTLFFLYLCVSLCFCSPSIAQDMAWHSLSPNNVAGATRTLIIDHNNSTHLWAASVYGGLFESTDSGQTWNEHPQNYQATNGQPAFVNLAFMCGVQAANGDIYLGTGEGSYLDSSGESSTLLPGNGIYKSTNGGQTFEALSATQPTGEAWKQVYKITIAPNGTVYACHNFGLSYSTNNGNTWATPNGLPIGVAQDIAIGADGLIHLLLGNSYYRSSDNGNSFTNLGGNNIGQLPTIDTGNRRIVVSGSNPSKLYAVLIKTDNTLHAVYQSTDGGNTWAVIGEGGNIDFEPYHEAGICVGPFACSMAIDPINDNRLFLGGTTLWTWTPTQLDSGR